MEIDGGGYDEDYENHEEGNVECCYSSSNLFSLNNLSDKELLGLSGEWEQAGFDLVSRKYYPTVLSYCLSRLGNEADAQDVAQNVFLAAWRFKHKYEARDGSKLTSWFFRIAQNLSLTFIRKKKRRGMLFDKVVLEPVFSDLTPQFDNYENRQLNIDTWLEEVLKSKDQLETFKLFYKEGFTYEEISKELEIKLGTVMSRLHRVRSILKDVITDSDIF